EASSRPRRHWDFQPFVLRRSPDRPSAPGVAAKRENAARACQQTLAARTLRGYQCNGAISFAKRDWNFEVFPAPLEERTEAPVPRSSGQTGKELEILSHGSQGTRALGRIPGRL